MANTKLTVSLPDDAMDAIKQIASAHQISRTAALRRALATYAFLVDRARMGQKVLVRDEGRDSFTEVIMAL